MPCLFELDMHHTWLCIMPWICCVCLPHRLLVSGLPLLDSLVTFRSVWIRLTTSGSAMLRGFIVLQSGIPGKVIITLDIITSFALLVVSMLSFDLATYHLFASLAIAKIKPLTSTILTNLCLAMLPLAQALLLVLLVAGAVCSMLGHGYLGISLYHAYLINLDYTLGKGWKAQAYAPVICSTLATLVFIIPVLCSLMSAPNVCGVYGAPLIPLSLCWTFTARPNIGTKICQHKTCIGSN